MGWRPVDFNRASLPEVYGALVGRWNDSVEQARLAWEPARFIAYYVVNSNPYLKRRLKNEQALRRFPWEKREVTKADVRKVERQVMAFRGTVRNKWGLKYYGEA